MMLGISFDGLRVTSNYSAFCTYSSAALFSKAEAGTQTATADVELAFGDLIAAVAGDADAFAEDRRGAVALGAEAVENPALDRPKGNGRGIDCRGRPVDAGGEIGACPSGAWRK